MDEIEQMLRIIQRKSKRFDKIYKGRVNPYKMSGLIKSDNTLYSVKELEKIYGNYYFNEYKVEQLEKLASKDYLREANRSKYDTLIKIAESMNDNETLNEIKRQGVRKTVSKIHSGYYNTVYIKYENTKIAEKVRKAFE